MSRLKTSAAFLVVEDLETWARHFLTNAFFNNLTMPIAEEQRGDRSSGLNRTISLFWHSKSRYGNFGRSYGNPSVVGRAEVVLESQMAVDEIATDRMRLESRRAGEASGQVAPIWTGAGWVFTRLRLTLGRDGS